MDQRRHQQVYMFRFVQVVSHRICQSTDGIVEYQQVFMLKQPGNPQFSKIWNSNKWRKDNFHLLPFGWFENNHQMLKLFHSNDKVRKFWSFDHPHFTVFPILLESFPNFEDRITERPLCSKQGKVKIIVNISYLPTQLPLSLLWAGGARFESCWRVNSFTINLIYAQHLWLLYLITKTNLWKLLKPKISISQAKLHLKSIRIWTPRNHEINCIMYGKRFFFKFSTDLVLAESVDQSFQNEAKVRNQFGTGFLF